MKKHNLLKVLLITILLVVMATWTLSITGVSNGEFVTQNNTSVVGLFSVADYFLIALSYFGHIALFVLAVGGLYGVLHKIPQYRVLLDKIVKGFDGLEWLFMIIIGVIFAVLSSMVGMSLVLLMLFPFVISIVLLMGYDRITAIMLTVGSTIAGLIGSVFSANDVFGITDVLSSFKITASSNFYFKLILLVVSLAIVLINTILYARKHRNVESNVNSDCIPEKVETRNKTTYPIVIVLDVLLIVLGLAFFSWDLFEISFFSDITASFTKVGDEAVFMCENLNKILGISTKKAFGAWSLLEAALVVALAGYLLSLCYRKKFTDFLTDFGEGAKKAIYSALLIIMCYTVLVIVTNVPIQLSIVRNIINLGAESPQIIVMCIVAIVFSLFAVESYYGANSAGYYILAVTTAKTAGLSALVWQSMYGLTMLFAPTSVILMSTLAYTDVSYGKWLKAVWKLLLELFMAIFVILFIFNARL